MYPKNQHSKACLAAVKNHAYNLQFMHKQSRKICISTEKNYIGTLEFVKDNYQKNKLQNIIE